MAFSIGGLGSGIDTAALVKSLMQAERLPQGLLQTRQQAAQKQVTAWNDLRTRMQSLQTAAEALQTPAKALGATATTSNKDAVTATARPQATPGQYAIEVEHLAVAQQQQKTGLGPASMTVGAGRSYVLAGPLSGQVTLTGAAPGAHVVQVTRGSSAATLYGSPVLGAKPTDLTLSVDGGAPVTLTLAATHGTEADLLADLNGQLGPHATASVVGGRLQVTATSEGSTRSLQLGGGAATALGLPTSVQSGLAATVLVNGVSHSVEPQPSGGGARSEALGTTGITLSVGTQLRQGTTRAVVAETDGASTLADLQARLNVTGSPVTMALVPQGAGTTMVLTSTGTGTEGQLTVVAGTPVLDERLRTVTQPAQDAVVKVAGLTVTRSTNKLEDVVPGVTIDLLHKPTGTAPLVVTVARDTTGTVDRTKALVDSLNGVLTKVATDTRYDVKSKTGGPLVGDGTARSLAGRLFSTASSTAGAGSIRSLAQLGIETTRDGRFAVKNDVLNAALARDPDGVAGTLAGFADALAGFAKEAAETGGLLTGRRDGAQAAVDARQRQIDAMETRLLATEKRYKAQYAALETSMASLNSQGSALGAALSSFTRPTG